jgi:hypothetical protein
MGRAYSDITFTPGVRDVQVEKGSRDQYAFLDELDDRGDTLTPREAQFIRAADHFFQATVSETGWPYVQHRGGPAGFLKVLDSKTLGFADYRGNVQYLSVGNLRHDDRISIIIVDYPNRRRLKLLGRVRLAEDEASVAAVRDPAYSATVERAFIISVEGWDWNCPQHITPRFTEAEVAQLLKPLQDQVQKLRRAAVPAGPKVLGDGPLPLRIAGVRQLAPDVRAYELAHADGGVLPAVAAGSHIDVPVRLADGTTSTRSYSISSSPLRRDAYEIAVRREDQGKGGSAAVHQDFALGVQLNCSLPGNSFALDDRPHKAILIAGGIGITPIKAMAHALSARGDDFELHYACRSTRDAAFLGQLQEAFAGRVHVYAKDEGRRLDVAELISRRDKQDQLYVCGPTGLIADVTTSAGTAGIAADRVHAERFSAATTRPGDHSFVVHLVRSGRRITVPQDKTVLETLEAASIKAPSSCRIGNCGTCATRVLAGTPAHRDEALTAEQRAEQGLMCICISRAETTELALDL